MRRTVLPSLRGWLQSTAVLSVIAGYVLLLVVNAALADLQRKQQHLKLAASLLQQASSGALDAGPLRSLGLEARVVADGDLLVPTLRSGPSGQQWLLSRSSFQLPNSERRLLELRQDVTASLQQQQLSQLLLVAAAGASILFTSMLLRPVLKRGLVLPLNDLDQELQALEADTLGEHLLDPSRQPQELRAIAEAFNNLQQRLAAAWQRERSFVDGVAHELRTPITVISGHAQSLQADASDAIQPVVGLIAAEATRLGDLITVMLDFARGDAGRLSLSISELDAETLVLEVFERLQALAADRLRLVAPVNDAVLMIHADAERVQQCLAALVENALKFSDGAVQLAVTASSDAVSLHVRDQGSGIPEAERTQVLERFVRGSTAIGTRGSGIGLATVSLLMEAMQGELRIGDAHGGGADMQLRFKLSDRLPAP